MTYNQENYIGPCLQSILDQQVDFSFEVIVADDCSTDNTASIIREFQYRYPDSITAVLHEQNVGVAANYRAAHDLAKGEYVAHCDGDDTWLPDKLRYQADLLDQNPDASQCWGCAYLIDDTGKRIGLFPSRVARFLYPQRISARMIALSYALVGQHSMQMYRRSCKFDFDTRRPILDYWISFNMACKGPAIYAKKLVGGYRVTTTESLTRTGSKKKFAVDNLAYFLVEIIQSHRDFRAEAKANLMVRSMISRLRGHSIDVLDEMLERVKEEKTQIRLVAKSAYYFLLQKIW